MSPSKKRENWVRLYLTKYTSHESSELGLKYLINVLGNAVGIESKGDVNCN